MIDLLRSKQTVLEELCARFHVKRLSVFGSATRDDFNPDSSDIDLLVEFEPFHDLGYADNYSRLNHELESALGRPVDLISANAIENPYLRRSIEADKVQLYAA